MRVCEELSFNDLMNRCWSGAIDTLNTICDHDKEDELMGLLEEEFFSFEVPTLTAINDLLWFDSDWVFEMLNISEDDDDDEDEDEEDFDEWENNPQMDNEHDGDRFDFPERF